MSLPTSYWGEPIWKTLYTIAYTFPLNPSVEKIANAKAFYENLGPLLPCEECSEHYIEYLTTNSLNNITIGRQQLLEWVNNLENNINRHMQRPLKLLEERVLDMNKHNPDLASPPSTEYNNFVEPDLQKVIEQSSENDLVYIRDGTVYKMNTPQLQKLAQPKQTPSQTQQPKRLVPPTTRRTIRTGVRYGIRKRVPTQSAVPPPLKKRCSKCGGRNVRSVRTK